MKVPGDAVMRGQCRYRFDLGPTADAVTYVHMAVGVITARLVAVNGFRDCAYKYRVDSERWPDSASIAVT